MFYIHQTKGACAGVSTWDCTHKMGKTVRYVLFDPFLSSHVENLKNFEQVDGAA